MNSCSHLRSIILHGTCASKPLENQSVLMIHGHHKTVLFCNLTHHSLISISLDEVGTLVVLICISPSLLYAEIDLPSIFSYDVFCRIFRVFKRPFDQVSQLFLIIKCSYIFDVFTFSTADLGTKD